MINCYLCGGPTKIYIDNDLRATRRYVCSKCLNGKSYPDQIIDHDFAYYIDVSDPCKIKFLCIYIDDLHYGLIINYWLNSMCIIDNRRQLIMQMNDIVDLPKDKEECIKLIKMIMAFN